MRGSFRVEFTGANTNPRKNEQQELLGMDETEEGK